MPLDHVGFEGDVDEPDWARISTFGSSYGVVDSGDFAATRVPNQDRRLQLAPAPDSGLGWGKGVLVKQSGPDTVQFDPATGAPRWDTACLRRNWIDRTVSLVVLKGGATPTISPLRTTGRGNGTDDQPLWLAQVRPNEAAIGDLVDLRCWSGNGGLTASDTLALDYLKDLGSVVQIGDTQWVCIRDAQGAPAWSPRYQPTRGERPYISFGRSKGSPTQNFAYSGWNGYGRHYGANDVVKRGAADAHFELQPGGGTMQDGTSLVFKTSGVYAIHGRVLWDGGPNAYYANATFQGDYLGAVEVSGSGVVDGFSDTSVSDERWVPAGTRLGLFSYSNRAITVRDWRMWATRLGD